jgi:hypothetical protein
MRCRQQLAEAPETLLAADMLFGLELLQILARLNDFMPRFCDHACNPFCDKPLRRSAKVTPRLTIPKPAS